MVKLIDLLFQSDPPDTGAGGHKKPFAAGPAETAVGGSFGRQEFAEDGSFRAKRESREWMAELAKVFHRGFWEGGYYLGKPLGDWAATSNSQATEKKIYAGEITKYYARIGVAEVLVRAGSIKLGDDVWILGNTTGAVRAKIAELHTGEDGSPATEASQGVLASFPVPEKVRAGDQLYLIAPAVPAASASGV